MTLDGRVRNLETLETPDKAVAAWMAMRTMPLLFPNLRGAWLMNQRGSFLYDSSPQGKDMTLNGTIAFDQQSELLRYLLLNGTSTYLSRASSSELEITNSLSVMAWAYKQTAGTQFVMLAKSDGLPASVNQAFFFVVGSSDNLNLTVCSGTTNVSHTIPAPVGQWFFAAGVYAPSSAITLYLGTRDGWQTSSNTTSIPASINNPTSISLTIGSTHGGANLSAGRIALACIMNSGSNETLFRTVFEYTKAIFFS